MGRFFRGYKIKEVSEATGFSIRQIHWIGHFKLVNPHGSSKGAYYTLNDINKLKSLKKLFDIGFSPQHLSKLKEGNNTEVALSGLLGLTLDPIDEGPQFLRSPNYRLESLLSALPSDIDITVSRKSLPVPRSGISTSSGLSISMLEDWS